jgi:hypothetical protein
MQRWTPPVTLSPQEKLLMNRLTRVRALFGFLRDDAVSEPLRPYIEALGQVRAQDLEVAPDGGTRILTDPCDRLAVSSDRLAVSSDRLAVSSDRLAVSSDRLAVSSDLLAVSTQCLAESTRRHTHSSA